MIVIGLDGLEHAYVEKFNNAHLQQSYYGKIQVPIDPKYGCPMSPSVWYSFLSGVWNETLDFKKDWVMELLKKARKVLPISLSFGRRVRKTLKFQQLDFETFLSNDWVPYNVPYINLDNHPYSALRKLKDNVSKDVVADEMVMFFLQQTETFLQLCMDNTRHILGVFQFPDYIQHLMDAHHIGRIYMLLDMFIAQVKDIYRGPLIIMSDHGFDGELHSNHGFISSNVELDPFPRKITDFYSLFTELNSITVT